MRLLVGLLYYSAKWRVNSQTGLVARVGVDSWKLTERGYCEASHVLFYCSKVYRNFDIKMSEKQLLELRLDWTRKILVKMKDWPYTAQWFTPAVVLMQLYANTTEAMLENEVRI